MVGWVAVLVGDNKKVNPIGPNGLRLSTEYWVPRRFILESGIDSVKHLVQVRRKHSFFSYWAWEDGFGGNRASFCVEVNCEEAS